MTELATNGSTPTKTNDATELTVLLGVLARVKAGDFTARMPLEWTGLAGKVADSLNEVIIANQAFDEELARVSDVVGKQGRLSQRLVLGAWTRNWSRSLESVNSLLDALVRPTREMQRVTGGGAGGGLGEAGIAWLGMLASHSITERRVCIPTLTDPRGTDFSKAALLQQARWMLDLERRTIDAFVKLGVMMTDTCINYQTVQAATRGEHVAFGDTGVVIYSNSVSGARSNFEGGPSALSAGLTGRTPRYGYHLDSQRQATLRVRTDWTPTTLNEWGALGGVIGW